MTTGLGHVEVIVTLEQREIGDAEHLLERILGGVMPLSRQEGMERDDFS